MAAKMQLNSLMANMFAKGLLDDQFQQVQMLQDGSAPKFIADIVTLFCKEDERIIGELAKLLNKPCVDFNKVYAFVHQLKGSSASIGAHRVNNSCIQLCKFCEEKSIYGCLKTLNVARNDFNDLCSKFQTMLEVSPC
ncbi:unnamed protein product [Alopecurus aequalis]